MNDDNSSDNSSDEELEEKKDLMFFGFLQWSHEDVGDWIERLGFPIYRDCFVSNYITGRRLIIMDASALPKIGIYDFEHIKMITQKIRELLTVELTPWNRSISLPPKEITAMFLERKCPTGKRADGLTYDEFADQWEGLKFQPPLSNYCSMLPKD